MTMLKQLDVYFEDPQIERIILALLFHCVYEKGLTAASLIETRDDRDVYEDRKRAQDSCAIWHLRPWI